MPKEYRIFSDLEPLLMAMDVDIPAFLAKLHNTVGDYDRDLKYNLNVLNRLKSSEYLLLMDSKTGAYQTETNHAYLHDTDAYNLWMNISHESHTTGFALHLTEAHGQIVGSVSPVNIAERQKDIENNCIHPYRIDAFLPNGEPVSYTPEEWRMMAPSECDALLDWNRRFHDYDFAAVFKHIEALYNQDDRCNKTVAAEELIIRQNMSRSGKCSGSYVISRYVFLCAFVVASQIYAVFHLLFLCDFSSYEQFCFPHVAAVRLAGILYLHHVLPVAS